jgi:N6-adenosine-specific RNA methylase IME4
MTAAAISNYLECADARAMLDGLPDRHFNVIAADVPWKFVLRSANGTGRSAERHYATMTLADIVRLPVERHAADDCHLLFWVTGPFLAIGAHIPIMRSWGFEPKAIWGVWVKCTNDAWDKGFAPVDDTLFKMQMGHTSRQNAEFVILGRRGNPKRLSKAVRQVMMAPPREHSRKPEKFFANAQAYGAGPRLELFGRQARRGWIVRGDQHNKFKHEGT